jgi:hypothetical protein
MVVARVRLFVENARGFAWGLGRMTSRIQVGQNQGVGGEKEKGQRTIQAKKQTPICDSNTHFKIDLHVFKATSRPLTINLQISKLFLKLELTQGNTNPAKPEPCSLTSPQPQVSTSALHLQLNSNKSHSRSRNSTSTTIKMATPTLIDMPEPPSNPDTPTEAP